MRLGVSVMRRIVEVLYGFDGLGWTRNYNHCNYSKRETHNHCYYGIAGSNNDMHDLNVYP